MKTPHPLNLRDIHTHADKLDSYFEPYETHFSPLRERTLRILEIGVQYGGSLSMWRKYFHNSHVTGVDIDPLCKIHGGVKIGDQANPKFLVQFRDYDIIIDDGGHTMRQQQISFETLFPLLNHGGIYVIEDLNTSYWPAFFDMEKTTMEYLAEALHSVNAEASRHPRAEGRPPVRDREIAQMHFYPNLCFIYKRKNAKSTLERKQKTIGGVRYFCHKYLNIFRTQLKRIMRRIARNSEKIHGK